MEEWSAALLAGGGQVWGLRAGVVPRVAAAAAMRHFHPAESDAGGESWHGGSSSLHQSQLTFL